MFSDPKWQESLEKSNIIEQTEFKKFNMIFTTSEEQIGIFKYPTRMFFFEKDTNILKLIMNYEIGLLFQPATVALGAHTETKHLNFGDPPEMNIFEFRIWALTMAEKLLGTDFVKLKIIDLKEKYYDFNGLKFKLDKSYNWQIEETDVSNIPYEYSEAMFEAYDEKGLVSNLLISDITNEPDEKQLNEFFKSDDLTGFNNFLKNNMQFDLNKKGRELIEFLGTDFKNLNNIKFSITKHIEKYKNSSEKQIYSIVRFNINNKNFAILANSSIDEHRSEIILNYIYTQIFHNYIIE